MKAAEEASPLQLEEVALATAGRAALTPAQNCLLSERDVLQIIRGYQTDVPRLECTVKAFVAIAKWREAQDYATILAKEHPETQAGRNRFGAPLATEKSAREHRRGAPSQCSLSGAAAACCLLFMLTWAAVLMTSSVSKAAPGASLCRCHRVLGLPSREWC